MMELVDNQIFSSLLHDRSQVLISNGAKIVAEGAENFVLTRPLLSLILSESTQLEELLDAYGARSNQEWYSFRMHVAMLKNFSNAGYELLHLRHTIRSYEFQTAHHDFENDTEGAIQYVAVFLFCSLKQLIADTYRFHWLPPEEMLGYDFSENLPAGILPKNRTLPGKGSASQLVIHLATSFLNSTEDARFLDKASKAHGPQWRGLDFDLLSEASIRALEGKFHNLQSIYDTYVSYSNVEDNDNSLRRLRGHISVVLHLLKVTTTFIHFYERHICIQGDDLFCHKHCVLQSDWYLEIITHYLCRYSYEFLSSARDLCQQMLKHYAVVETIEVSTPPFFGFHVRPSTLISSIVRHYGSEVKMLLDKEYDASVPMNLFLANEWINQLKRKYVYEELAKIDDELKTCQAGLDAGELTHADAVRRIIRSLANRNVIRVLVYPLDVEPLIKAAAAPTLLELMQTVIASLHAQRALSIIFSTKVKFRGDVRILNDIRVLAENGYGENEHGDNIPLPPELAYLNHFRPAN